MRGCDLPLLQKRRKTLFLVFAIAHALLHMVYQIILSFFSKAEIKSKRNPSEAQQPSDGFLP